MPPRMFARWLVLVSLLLLAFLGTVTTLNLTLYSASGFVSSYLHAVAGHDLEGARRMPGVTVGAGATDELLTPAALVSLDGIHLIRDSDEGAGRHTVLYGYTIGGAAGTSSFVVQYTGARLGVFSGWRFVDSPAAVIDITVNNGTGVVANGIALPDTTPGRPHSYRVLVPSRVVLTHTSRYLTAAPVTALVDAPASVVPAIVEIQANHTFVREVQKQLDSYLATCATQKVLLPTGCPIGKPITDRIQDAPTWSIVTYPIVTIVPGNTAGSWQIPETAAAAHLVVTVKSIFDGRISTVNEDVPFTIRYLITFTDDGGLAITAEN